MKTIVLTLATLFLTGCAVDQNAWYMSPQPARCYQQPSKLVCRDVARYDGANRYIGEKRICGYQ